MILTEGRQRLRLLLKRRVWKRRRCQLMRWLSRSFHQKLKQLTSMQLRTRSFECGCTVGQSFYFGSAVENSCRKYQSRGCLGSRRGIHSGYPTTADFVLSACLTYADLIDELVRTLGYKLFQHIKEMRTIPFSETVAPPMHLI
ncbi:hypothetical protein BCR33DRAFT_166270 [Rhizoclosmatium globosum]|uniref:Uncharacterized protein n=1 Tax=Rhizoclosmatium globosum TaxID=329046 RepID=A0A1Y2AID9_9FUNG|nr:hypothetical protein BCR33DRAFT_166270 [Rhizoclosmatium globosum]|eukprot:ORY22040.1 hypothetical protein BCR33DRAFT_166270 [Rhizoclosmatium globosum]